MKLNRQLVWACVALAVALISPLILGGFTVTLATEILIFGIFVSGVNLLLGYTGLVPLGNAMFLGMGAYGIGVFANLLGWSLWLAIPATLLTVLVLATVIGIICTRTRDVEFLLITLAFGQMFYGAAIKTKATGGSDGLPGIARPDFSLININVVADTGFYYLVLAVAVAMLLIFWRLIHSPFGSVLVGIRENEKRMISMSYAVSYYKTGAFVIAALYAAVAGILSAQHTHFVSPEIMNWQIGGEAVLMVIIGGRRYVLGGILGAGIFIVVKYGLSRLTQDYLIFFGLFFMLCVAFLKDGIIGLCVGLRKRVRA
jgi:branched-chain amino acid transport system permease protein